MLTADLVNARRRGGDLKLVPLKEDARERAEGIATALVAIAKGHVGRSREELTQAAATVPAPAKDKKLKDGLIKLVLDRCVFDANEDLDPEAVREAVFTRSAARRAALAPGERLDREAVLAEAAEALGESPDRVEKALFADLRGAHQLVSFDPIAAPALVRVYERAQAQAVLLRAVKVTIDVRCKSPAVLRAFFRRLKFLRLLHTIAPIDGGHRIVVDGPFTLFGPVTKYGLQLALLVPALEECDAWKLEADVRWGIARTPLVFHLEGTLPVRAGNGEVPLADDVQSLVDAFRSRKSRWTVSPSTKLLDLPGVGLVVPDLVFEHVPRGQPPVRVQLEVLGYWSRDAVWKRVELVKAGLGEPILFAISSRLRVSEAVLGDDLPGALYVYKGSMSAKALEERLERFIPAGEPPAA